MTGLLFRKPGEDIHVGQKKFIFWVVWDTFRMGDIGGICCIHIGGKRRDALYPTRGDLLLPSSYLLLETIYTAATKYTHAACNIIWKDANTRRPLCILFVFSRHPKITNSLVNWIQNKPSQREPTVDNLSPPTRTRWHNEYLSPVIIT